MSDNRYFLMAHKNGGAYSILDAKTCHIGAMLGGKPCVSYAECMEAAETLPGLLGKLWCYGSDMYYVTLSWINSKGQTKETEYPLHYANIHLLTGYVEDVCDIRRAEDHMIISHKSLWQVDFPPELWIKTDDFTLKKVYGFDTMMEAAVEEYISENGLEFEDGAECPWVKYRIGDDQYGQDTD